MDEVRSSILRTPHFFFVSVETFCLKSNTTTSVTPNNYNFYMEADDGRSSTRFSFPVYKGDWKWFQKHCLAEAHPAGVNEAITVATKAHSKKWEWSFVPDLRQEITGSSDDEGDLLKTKQEAPDIKTRAQTAQETIVHTSKWERFPAAFAEAARYQNQRLCCHLGRALD